MVGRNDWIDRDRHLFDDSKDHYYSIRNRELQTSRVLIG